MRRARRATHHARPYLLDDHRIQLELCVCALHDLLLNAVGCHEAVHRHWLGLSDTVSAIHGLQIDLGQDAT